MAPMLLRFWRLVMQKHAKKSRKEAKANYDKVCESLAELHDNFNAAFESSAETENWTADNWIVVTTDKSIWRMIMIEFH